MGSRWTHKVNHAEPFVFPARKQLPKRTIQDVLEEQAKDEDREAKRKKEEEGEAPGGGRARERELEGAWWGIWKGGGLSQRPGWEDPRSDVCP